MAFNKFVLAVHHSSCNMYQALVKLARLRIHYLFSTFEMDMSMASPFYICKGLAFYTGACDLFLVGYAVHYLLHNLYVICEITVCQHISKLGTLIMVVFTWIIWDGHEVTNKRWK